MTFLFKCKDCHQEFEISANITDFVKTNCPSCKGNNVIRKYSSIPFILKGLGFYKTDNRPKEN
jgi:putative FmdB family regulatory protein